MAQNKGVNMENLNYSVYSEEEAIHELLYNPNEEMTEQRRVYLNGKY